ncbi:MAG: serine/threonine-protein kinase [Bryobacteraceae bacterium]|nr:serine/threonine-protein kinase [Bryobacteraceae bacterium]
MNSGQTIGNYELLERIGSGGMGEVFRARDTTLERQVAIKFVRPLVSPDTGLSQRIRAEAQAMARLQQAGITQLYSLLDEGGQLAMVMEFAEGETLESLLKREGPLPFDRAVSLFLQCLDAFECAHRMGVVHRDVKPANVMICASDRVKVMDFGVAHIVGAESHGLTGQFTGTPLYMAPEQITGAGIDWRCDLYSLGVLLFEMLTGEPPFRRNHDFAVMRAHVEDPPPPASQLMPALPRGIDQVLGRALAKDPALRYQSAAEFRENITRCLTAPAAPTHAPASRRSLLAPKWRYAGAVAVLAVLVAAGALGFQSSRTAEPTPLAAAPCPEPAPAPAEPPFEMAAGPPLSRNDLILLLQAATPNLRMISIVNARGVVFVNGPESAGEILRAGGSHELNGVVALNYRPVPVAPKPTGSALQGQSLLQP